MPASLLTTTYTRVLIAQDSATSSDDNISMLRIASGASLFLQGRMRATGNITSTGEFTSTGTIDASSGKIMSRITTVSASSANMNDGEFGFFRHAASGMSFMVRSGQTTYHFNADGAAVA